MNKRIFNFVSENQSGLNALAGGDDDDDEIIHFKQNFVVEDILCVRKESSIKEHQL